MGKQRVREELSGSLAEAKAGVQIQATNLDFRDLANEERASRIHGDWLGQVDVVLGSECVYYEGCASLAAACQALLRPRTGVGLFCLGDSRKVSDEMNPRYAASCEGLDLSLLFIRKVWSVQYTEQMYMYTID